MDLHIFWIIALSIATPIAGIVGFAIQLREVKKVHLENEKLQFEIDALRKKAEDSGKRIVQVSTAEVQRFASRDSVLFSLAPPSGESFPVVKQKTSLKETALAGRFQAPSAKSAA